MNTRDLTSELLGFCLEHWTRIAAFAACGPQYIDTPGYILFRGELIAPTPWLEPAAGHGRLTGGMVHLLRFRPGPEWIDTADLQEQALPGSLEQRACGPDTGRVYVAWEFEPGKRVWTVVQEEPDPIMAAEQLTDAAMPPRIN